MNPTDIARTGLPVRVGVFALSLVERSVAPTPSTTSYSSFLPAVREGEVERVSIGGNRIIGWRSDGTPFSTYSPNDFGWVGDLLDAGVSIEARPVAQTSALARPVVALLPILLLIGVWVWFMRRQLGGGGSPLSFTRSTARRVNGELVGVTLADVAGVDEARQEVGELVTLLRDPSRLTQVGGLIPRGILMAGPPGTGKTLLARAVAGEAGVPFFAVSGSDFVAMFAGVGASRMRDLFAQAERTAPCIVFIDEIDAVGRRRGAGMGVGNEEREQTLNPERDRYSASRQRLENQICTLLGGRLAEEIVYRPEAVTMGAQTDIQQATRTARDMVTRYGLSAALGPVSYCEAGASPGGGTTEHPRVRLSQRTARHIDEVVRAVIRASYRHARALLEENRDSLDRIAAALLRHETLHSDQIDALMAGVRMPDPALDRDNHMPPRPSSTSEGRERRPRQTLPAAEH